MLEKYDAAYYRDKLAMDAAAFDLVSRVRAAKLQPDVTATDTVFEYGVGSGINLEKLSCAAKLGWDVNPAASNVARSYGVTVLDSLDQVAGGADVTVCHHVLEHMMSPADGLHDIHASLKPGGRALIFVPYERARRYSRPIPEDRNYHLFAWNVHTMTNLVQACGLEVREAGLRPFGYGRYCAQLAGRLGLGFGGYRWLWRLAHLVRPEQEIRILAVRPS
ncbi:MAG: methyltransferase domain-containing protein [Roseomonas sp.]|nr:methyltransferase domain-containing protein [Roseomonas sp.]